MTRAQLVFTVIGIVIVGYFINTWYSRNSVPAAAPPSPIQQAQNRPAPAPAKKKPAKVEVKKYDYKTIDQSRFSVVYTITNTGQMGAEQVQIQVKPWVGGGYNPDRGMELDPKDPILLVSQSDYIQKLAPGESVMHTKEFFFNTAYFPGRNLDCVQIVSFKETPE